MKNHVMAWRNILRNKRRTALSIVSIAIAAMSMTFLFSFLTGFSVEMEENLQRYYFGDLRLRHTEFEKNANLNPLHLSIENLEPLLANLKEQSEFVSVGGRTQFPALVYINNEDTGIQVMGLEFATDPINLTEYLIEGDLPAVGKREVVLGKKLANKLNLSVGDKFTAVTMTMRRASNGMTFTIAGIAHLPLNDLNNIAYVPLSVAQRFLKMTDRAVDIILRTSPSTDLESGIKLARKILTNQQEELINERIAIEAWNEIPSAYIFIRFAQLAYYIIGVVFYLLASTVIINTITMVIFERTKEVGTLASMGMESKEIVHMFFLEACFISTIGSALGVFIAAILTIILEQTGIDFSEAIGEMDFQTSGIVYPRLTLPNMIIAFLTGVIVASGVSFLPSRRAARIQPAEAMRKI